MEAVISPVMSNLKTAHAGTTEWLQASRNMVIAAYTGTEPLQTVSLGGAAEENEEPVIGAHLREAAATLKKLLSS